MWKKIKIFALILFVVSGVFMALLNYGHSYNIAGRKTIEAIILVLEKTKREKGSYPTSLENSEEINKARVKVLGILPSPTVEYRLIGSEFDIYYYQLPFGPVYGYESRSKDWYYYD